MTEAVLIQQFHSAPESAYRQLLKEYSPIILRMIRRFMSDPDEIMEVYTSICERLCAHDFSALRRFRIDSEISPWMSVVVANACRDRFRRRRVTSVPQSVINKLDEREQLVFRYYYQDNYAHEDIAEIIKSNHGLSCTALEVVRAVGRINELLSINKRWHLLTALRANKAALSLDELMEDGQHPNELTGELEFEEALRHREQLESLNEAFQTLSSEDQLLLLLRFEHGLKATEVAEIMSFENDKYVYTRIRTVINRLRKVMKVAA